MTRGVAMLRGGAVGGALSVFFFGGEAAPLFSGGGCFPASLAMAA